MFKRLAFCLLFVFSSLALSAQQYVIPDTLLFRTEKNPLYHQENYILKGETQMIVNFGEPKNDTLYRDRQHWTDGIEWAYKSALRTYNIRLKSVKDLDADEVFDYFPMGITPEKTLEMLGDKKVAVSDNLLEVAFYNHFSKKNEVFSFKFHEGKLYGITRPSTNTLPTDDVWTAFQLVELRSNINKLQEVIKQLEK